LLFFISGVDVRFDKALLSTFKQFKEVHKRINDRMEEESPEQTTGLEGNRKRFCFLGRGGWRDAETSSA
jgi:hypothetical protein